MSILQDIGAAVDEVARGAAPATLGVARPRGRPASAFVLRPGAVVTAAYAAIGEPFEVAFRDGRRAPGELAGVDARSDLAVVRVDTGDAAPLPWGEAGGLRPGAAVVAFANPAGRGFRASLGFVTATGRSFRGSTGRRIDGAIEHGAPLVRGSGGGPLVDAAGDLVGVNAVRQGGGAVLAVPVDAELRARLEALAAGEARGAFRLGVAVAPARVARRLRTAVGLPERDGLLVRAVQAGSPAAAAGIETGDLIAAAAGRQLRRVDDLFAVLDEGAGAASLELTVVRGADERAVAVALPGAGA